MKRKIVGLILVVCLLIAFCSAFSMADSSYAEIPECSCHNEHLELALHADGCLRKAYCRDVSKLSAKELFDMWGMFPEDIREFILTYLGWTNWSKQQELQELLADYVEVQEDKEGCICKPESTYGSIKHSTQCPYHFANLIIEEEYIVYITMTQKQQADALATLNVKKQAELEEYIAAHPYAHTVSEDGVSVTACDVPQGATVTAEVVDKEFTESLLPSMTLANEANFALDIKVYDEKGNEYQPGSAKPVMVKVSVPETKVGQKTEFLHILDNVDSIQKGLSNESVKLLDISYLFEDTNEDGEPIEVVPVLSDAYWEALAATEQLGYEKQIACEIITGTCVDDGYSTFYTESFSAFSNASLGSGTYYIKWDLTGNDGNGKFTGDWRGHYTSIQEDEDSLANMQRHQYYYDSFGNVTISSGATVNFVFIKGSVPVSGTITVNGTLNVSLYSGSSDIKFYRYKNNIWGNPKNWQEVQDKTLSSNQRYYDANNTIYRSSGFTGHIFSVGSSGTLNLAGQNDATRFVIDGKSVANAGAAIVSSGKVNLDYVTVNNNHKNSGGGAMILQGSSSNTLDYINVNNCTATGNGGAFYISGSATCTLNNVNISNCTADYAGGIYISSSGNFTFNASKITNCTALSSAGGIYLGSSGTNTISSSTISGCTGIDGPALLIVTTAGATNVSNSTFNGNRGIDGELGGTIRTYGTTVSQTTFTNCNIYQNYAGKNGGGFYWNAGSSSKLTIDSCNIYNNTASDKGGGVFCESIMEIKGSTNIYGNTSADGGGICVNAYGGTIEPSNSGSQLNLASTISIYDNTSSNVGGGISMNIYKTDSLYSDAVFMIRLNGAKIYNNTAVKGGGIHIFRNSNAPTYQCTVDLNYGEFKNNTATAGNGGGVYTENVNVTIGNTSGTAMTISGNKAPNGAGGAVYSTGSLGTCSITNGTLTGNSAGAAGAIGVYNSVVNVNGGTLNNNSATTFGGAIGATGASAGVTVSGNGTISSNTAANGGGIYATGGAQVNVTGGIISNNSAKGTPSVTTAYNDAATKGVGGGIYVGNGTSSKSSSVSLSGSSVGLYGNTADFAAADAYTSGTYTKMSLPEVHNMNLTGYSGSATGWYEDYVTGDTAYANGLQGGSAGERYAKARNTIEVASSSNITKYASITLGTTKIGYGNLTIQKSGDDIDPNQVFIFQVTGNGISMEVSVKGKNSITIYSLPDGTYTVKEVKSWSWRYTPTSETLSATISGSNVNPTVTFKNTLSNRNWLTALYNLINVKG